MTRYNCTEEDTLSIAIFSAGGTLGGGIAYMLSGAFIPGFLLGTIILGGMIECCVDISGVPASPYAYYELPRVEVVDGVHRVVDENNTVELAGDVSSEEC